MGNQEFASIGSSNAFTLVNFKQDQFFTVAPNSHFCYRKTERCIQLQMAIGSKFAFKNTCCKSVKLGKFSQPLFCAQLNSDGLKTAVRVRWFEIASSETLSFRFWIGFKHFWRKPFSGFNITSFLVTNKAWFFRFLAILVPQKTHVLWKLGKPSHSLVTTTLASILICSSGFLGFICK